MQAENKKLSSITPEVRVRYGKTAGLVGIIDLVSASLKVMPVWKVVVGTLVTCIILPAAVAFGVSELLRKIGWIKKNDMKIDI